MESNVIDFQKVKEKEELKSFFKLLKLGKMIEITNYNSDGIPDLYEFSVRCLGFYIGTDFITLSNEPKIYPVNFEIKEDYFPEEDENGIFVVELTDMTEKDKDYKDFLRNNLDIARKSIKHYFDLFNKHAIEYDTDSEELLKYDVSFVETSKPKKCPILKFKKNK